MKALRLPIILRFIISLVLLCNTHDLLYVYSDENSDIQVPVIMYHSLFDKKTHQWNIPPAAFESDLAYLAENGYSTVFLSDLVNYVSGAAPLPHKPVMLTFDDGYYNNYTRAMPLLEKYGAKIVLSVIGSASDLWTRHPDEKNENGGHLTWPQIAEMAASRRVEFANHTQDLHKTDCGRNGCCRKEAESLAEYEALLSNDVTLLQKKLELSTGTAPICFTYPFGSMCEESEAILKKLGFKATLSCVSGVNHIKTGDESCLFHLRRNNRTTENSVKNILESIGTPGYSPPAAGNLGTKITENSVKNVLENI